MRTSARFFLGLVVAALVALGLVVLLSASQPASRQALRYSRNKAVEALSASLAHAQARMQRAAPEEYESTRLEVSRLEKELLSLKARPLSPYFFWKKQLVFCLIGLVLAVLVARFDYHRWRDWNLATVLFVFEIALLLAVFFFPEHKGSRRWISLGFADLQPSEFAKIVVVLVLSVWMDKASWRVERFVRGAVMPALIIAALIVPILFEPDFGSSMVIALAGGLVMTVAGTRWRYIVPMGIFGMLAIATLILSNPNRRERLFVQYGHLLDSKDNAVTTQCVRQLRWRPFLLIWSCPRRRLSGAAVAAGDSARRCQRGWALQVNAKRALSSRESHRLYFCHRRRRARRIPFGGDNCVVSRLFRFVGCHCAQLGRSAGKVYRLGVGIYHHLSGLLQSRRHYWNLSDQGNGVAVFQLRRHEYAE